MEKRLKFWLLFWFSENARIITDRIIFFPNFRGLGKGVVIYLVPFGHTGCTPTTRVRHIMRLGNGNWNVHGDTNFRGRSSYGGGEWWGLTFDHGYDVVPDHLVEPKNGFDFFFFLLDRTDGHDVLGYVPSYARFFLHFLFFLLFFFVSIKRPSCVHLSTIPKRTTGGRLG